MATNSQIKSKRQAKPGKYNPSMSDAALQNERENIPIDENFYRNVVESLEDYAVFTTDTKGNISSWNKGAERLLGFTEEEIIGKNIDIIFVPEDRAEHAPEDELKRAAKDKKAVNERYHIRKDGSRFWGSGLVFPLKDEQGKLHGFTKVMRDLTDRQKASEKAQQSKERFQTLIEKSSDVIALSDAKGNYSYASPGIKKVLGYTPEEFTTMNGFDLMHPDELGYVGEKLQKLLAHPGASETIELRARHKDGSWRWLEATATNLLGNSNINAIVSNFRDITERKTAEQEHAAITEEAEQFFNLPDLLLAIASTDGYFKRLNPAWEKILGHSLKELTSHPWTDFVHPDDVAATIAEGEKLKAGATTLQFQNRYRCKNGSYKWILWNVRPVGDVLYAAAQDITTMKGAEEQLQESEEQLRLLVQGVKDYAIFRLDPKGYISSWNQGAENIKGYKAEEIIGKHISAFYTPENRQQKRPDKLLRKARTHGEVVDEGWRVKKDGSRFWANVTITAIKDGSGKLIGFSKITRDMTERKSYEETLRESRERFALAQQAANIGTFEWSIKANEFLCTEQLEVLYGLQPAQMQGDLANWLKRLHPADRERIQAELQEALNGKRLDTEFRIVRPNGDIRWIAMRGKVFMDEKGQPERLLGINRNITKRKQAEQQVEHERQRLHDLMMQAPAIMVVVTGPNHIFELANSMYLQLIGKDKTIIGKPLREVLPEMVEQGYLELLDNVYKSGEPFIGKEMLARLDRSGDGKLEDVYLNFIYQPIKDSEGKVESIFGHAVDVTEQVRARQKVEDSEARLRFMAESMPQKIFTAKPSGEVDYFNPQWMEFTGLSFEQIRAWGWKQFIHPDDLEENIRLWQESIRTGKPFQMEHRFRRYDGVYRWHFSRAHAFRDSNGKIITWIGSNTDITDVKKTQEALVQSEERFRQLADSMPQIVWTATPDGKEDYYNQQWYEFTGFVPGQKGQSWKKILHPDDVKYCNETWQESIRTGKPFQTEYRFRDRHRPGKYRWFLGRALAIKDNKGNITKWFGTATDIDDIRRTTLRKEELEKLTAALELQRNQLMELNNAKDEFISLASHQLRTPATGVKQYVGMLLEGYVGTLTPEQETMLQYAFESNERQLRIIDDLLKVAHVDAGKIEINKKQCNLVPLVHNVLREQLSAFQARGQKLIYNKPDEPVEASIDTKLIRMVIENLVNNAGKYTPKGKQIKVKVSEKTRPKCAVVSVRDQGVGIDPEDFPKLFRKFSRLRNPLSEEVGGTGLGLYWVKRVIDLHGGNIKVKSAVGKGTTFTLELPAKD